ncbi:predicted protein [Histoplasma capsulatum G186AR]|uniref:Glucose-methanol-choline oxidoreductase N-terminal domain-containing protein n=1 Tax=Ajellomyces capsulatus (strain G186AR / H82 / ATCC MYA-2454 / RMSCC 2432) TaxID=447093 RepID=C0NGI2_AJECG|nr:uncharacterized protein HCBG_02454 [Histoplasma capsulatum G186AR]EEH08917.1 predicted protein [Histoplasma capsulatum G186AR]
MTIPDEVDIVVCGGGSSGYFPVGRILANLNNRLRVLLIETDEDVPNNLWKGSPHLPCQTLLDIGSDFVM